MRVVLSQIACTLVAIGIGISSASAGNCGFVGKIAGVCAAIDAADRELQEMRKMLDATARAAIQAVPGERYLQIIDDLNSGDKDRVDRARAFLTRLMHVNPAITYQATVRFSFDETKDFRYDVFQESSPSIDIVAQRASNAIVLVRANRTVFAPGTTAAARGRIADNIIKALDTFLGPGPKLRQWMENDLNSTPALVAETLSYPTAMTSRFYSNGTRLGADNPEQAGDLAKRTKELADRKQAIVQFLTDAIMETVTEKREEVATGVREFEWDVLADKNFLIITIDEDTYSKHNDFEIVAAIHEKGKPGETLYQRPAAIFQKVDFRAELNPPVKDKRGRQIYWAFQDMTARFNLTSDRLKEIAELKKTLAEWEVARGGK